MQTETEETNTRKLGRMIAKFAVVSSTGTTVAALVKNHLPEATKTSQKVQFAIGSFAIASVVSSRAADWINNEFDEFYELADKVKEAKAEVDAATE